MTAAAAVSAVWKAESARIIAGLTRMVRDVGLAEELAQDALVAALEQWPDQGVPDNPGAWLMTAAKRRAVDHLRRGERQERKHAEIARTLEQEAGRDAEADQDTGAGRDAELSGASGLDDDVLRLMFISSHPVLPTEERAALTLRLLGGLTSQEIARAFLVPEQTVAQRIAKAKRTLADEQIPFELPPGPELATRLASVLEVLYLIFNEGYSATAGDDLTRPALALEALRLGRLLAGLAPGEAEVHGLVALMQIQQSRSAARTGPSGEPVQLHEQDRGLWDRDLINRGFASMLRARQSGGPLGPYVLQAAIAVSHAQAESAAETNWPQIAALYGALARLMPSPVVQLNRAVAVGMAEGPEAGLALIDELTRDPALKDYHPLSVVHGDLLARLGRHEEARTQFERAAALTRNAAERTFLLKRATAPHPPTTPRPDTPAPETSASPGAPTRPDSVTGPGAPTRPGSVTGSGAPPRQDGVTGHDAPLRLDGVIGPGTDAPETSAPPGAPTRPGSVTGPGTDVPDAPPRSNGTTASELGVMSSDGAEPVGGVVRTLGEVVEGFLARADLGAETLRSYGQTLRRLRLDLGPRTPLGAVDAAKVARVFALAWGTAAPKTWNRHRAAVRSFSAWAAIPDLSTDLERRAESRERRPAMDGPGLQTLWRHPSLRERTLWRLIHESGAGAKTVLSLNVEDLDLEARRARVGPTWITWGYGTAELLSDLLAGRSRGPVFLADRRPAPARRPKPADLCPVTGRGRLSYERSEYLFKQASGGFTLHQLKVWNRAFRSDRVEPSNESERELS
ncbi:sigma-70 family RNA polymerase sigma factor [Nonomuraea endophytica]|uniref:sigma-70 family RNA polymerase sigma factor n=1 Tax=Nonomuraea endophytica TaxID=714136 RepID=UPI0037CB287A